MAKIFIFPDSDYYPYIADNTCYVAYSTYLVAHKFDEFYLYDIQTINSFIDKKPIRLQSK